jgi:signal transduction histidine kinase
MIFSGTISVLIIDKIHVQGAIDEYVLFTDNIYAELVKEKILVPNTPLKDLNKEVNKVKDKLISWKIIFKSGPPCDVCKYVAQSGEIDVYSNAKNQWFSVYKLPDIDAWLVIFETNIFNFAELKEAEEKKEDKGFFSGISFHDIEDLTQLMIVFITIAVAIYWPVTVIKRQIENLIRVQHQFGAGNLSTRANYQFTRPIDELATSFNTMANSISDTVKENQIFAQAVPHEIRTPLSRIQLAVGLLSQNNNNKQQIELLSNIDTYIDDINVLINQVVSFSKLNSIKSKDEVSLYQTINWNTFVESRIKATRCDEKRNVICHIDESLEITTNPAYLRLLVDNLLKNACIHSKSQIIVSLTTVNENTELSVEDDGDGIPNEFLDTIFIPFSRVDVSRSRNTGGLGLGLAISKAACIRMNSQLSVENLLSSGAKFICRFSNSTES